MKMCYLDLSPQENCCDGRGWWTVSCSILAETTPFPGCSQPVTEHSRGPRGRPFLLTWDNPVRKTCPLLSWVIFALEIPILQAKIFSELHFRKGFCYTILPPCPSPFTDVRPTPVSETLPTLPSTSLYPSGAFPPDKSPTRLLVCFLEDLDWCGLLHTYAFIISGALHSFL